MKITTLLVASVLFAAGAQGQTVTGVTGDFVHGQEMIISGAGFGQKARPAPGVWDDVESGQFNPAWDITGTMRVGTESRHQNSHFCGTNNFQRNGGDGGHGYFTGGPLGDHYFAQYWFMLDNNWNWGDAGPGEMGASLANVKIFRMWNPSSSIDENFVMATRLYAASNVQYYAEHVSNPAGGYFGNINDWTLGVWHLFQFEYKESSVGGNDGEIRMWIDGQLALEDTDLMTREDYSELKRPYILGFYNSWGDDGADRDDFYIDDAYADNSWARVEVGNAALYNDCTHREVQIPTGWEPGQVTVEVNTGSFTADDTLYLFVVNEDGDISPGFPLGEAVELPGLPPQPRLGPRN